MAYTHLKPGVELEITARAYFESASADMSSLVQLSPETLKEREEASAAQEEVIYDEAQAVIQKWYAQAAQTINYRKAQEYLKVCPVSHTSNQWTVDQHGRHEMSNMVYCFSWREYERTEWSRAEQKSVVVAWDLSWSLHFNTTQNPDCTGSGRRLAGQDRKVFKNRMDMEKIPPRPYRCLRPPVYRNFPSHSSGCPTAVLRQWGAAAWLYRRRAYPTPSRCGRAVISAGGRGHGRFAPARGPGPAPRTPAPETSPQKDPAPKGQPGPIEGVLL